MQFESHERMRTDGRRGSTLRREIRKPFDHELKCGCTDYAIYKQRCNKNFFALQTEIYGQRITNARLRRYKKNVDGEGWSHNPCYHLGCARSADEVNDQWLNIETVSKQSILPHPLDRTHFSRFERTKNLNNKKKRKIEKKN